MRVYIYFLSAANISKLVQLLGQVPRIILLILKTNDLSMSIITAEVREHIKLNPLIRSTELR